LSLAAGARLGHFEIVGPLGAGGMGEVYKARDTRLDRVVALKVLRPEVSNDAHRRARFEREARAISRLTHPHICTLHDVGREGEVDYLVMECLEGETLAQRLRAGPLPTAELLETAIHIGEGLEWAHRQGILHRDLKPANVMLTRTGTKLLDFGLAKMVESPPSDLSESPTDTADPGLTGPGMLVGTLSYLAPEQLEGREADTRTDIYALGAVLYEMATGYKPFTGASNASLVASILKGHPPPITEAAPEFPLALDRLVRQCLERDPDQRWQSVHDVVNALRWMRDGTGAPPVVRRRGPWIIVAGTAVVLAMAVSLRPWRTPRPPAPPPSAATRVAVLAFENQGTPDTDYFAEGMSDEVRGKLAALPDLVVVASTTSSQYKKTTKPIQEVARELGARYLVVGKVRWAPGEGRVQVVPELIEVEEDGAQTEKWRDSFDASMANLFDVQAQIAGKVARSLGVALSARQRTALQERPTENLGAYDAFLRGEMALRRGPPWQALAPYQEAVRLDPNFALAWAHLSRANSARYENLPTAELAMAARDAAQRAVALAPDAPDGYIARSQYYAGVEGDSVRALPDIEQAERLAPHNVEVLNRKARLERNLGRWEESVRISEQARFLDPRAIQTAKDLVDSLTPMRRFAEARAEADRALALDPTDPEALANRVVVSLGEGDLDGARSLLATASADVDRFRQITVYMIDLAPWAMDENQQRLALTLEPAAFGGNRAFRALGRAELYWLRGDRVRSRENAEVARAEYETLLRTVRPGTQIFGVRISRALALAYLGRKAEAIAEGERAAALRPTPEDALWGPTIQENVVKIYLLFGEREKALDRLEPLLKIPSDFSPGLLRIDPTFAPLHGNPRFQKLISGVD
jgi:eukaryotic-like serine/threonine-protein kinase